MEIIKVIPRGFCIGVVKSLKVVSEVIKKYPDKKIYCIGMLVHNKNIIEDLTQKNVITLDDFGKNRIDLVNSLPKNSILIFSAHGTDSKIIEYAISIGHKVYDTKCSWVLETENLIKEYLDKDYEIIFVGKKNHPETIALTSISNKIIKIFSLDDVKKLNINNKKILVTNQTTLSVLDLEGIFKLIKEKFNYAIFKNDICSATLERQKAVLDLKNKKVDLLYVVGDERSNNTLKLVEIGKSINIKTILVSKKEDININDLKNINKIAVTAGASTPSIIQNNVIKFLEEI